MSYGTSDSTVISPIKPEAHNLNTTIASAALWDGSRPASLRGNTAENRQLQFSLLPTYWAYVIFSILGYVE